MPEQPPLNRSYVISYAANDRDFPTIGLRADPRVAGYRVPEDLSPHPDSKRYPNHVFTGSQPSNGDERVTHIYEILPSPWVPFTRYDDDLGPIQGRRRSVKNEGQVARLGPDQRVTYEAREGSAIVYTELEEAWSTQTDDDGNSLFPIKDRDFYDPSRGAVQERRQLFVPTGEEEGMLENINGVITQTSYEAYNEYLSVKIVQTYKVDGPQLVGRATNNDGQLVTVTTQRKGIEGYVPPSPTATRTVEVNREDAESLIERVVDTPEVFDAKTLSTSKPDVIPERFAASVPTITTQETIIKNNAEAPVLASNDISGTEERATEFTVRKTLTTRESFVFPELNGVNYDQQLNVGIPYTETISETLPLSGAYDAEPIDDTRYLIRSYDNAALKVVLDGYLVTYPSKISLNLPKILKSIVCTWDEKADSGITQNEPTIIGSFKSVSINDQATTSSFAAAKPKFDLVFEEIDSSNVSATTHVFFMENPTEEKILEKLNAQKWPVFKLDSRVFTFTGATISGRVSVSASSSFQSTDETSGALQDTLASTAKEQSTESVVLNIPPCIHGSINVTQDRYLAVSPVAQVKLPQISLINTAIDYLAGINGEMPSTIIVPIGQTPPTLEQQGQAMTKKLSVDISMIPTSPSDVPRSGTYLTDTNIEFFKFGFFIVRATTINAGQFA